MATRSARSTSRAFLAALAMSAIGFAACTSSGSPGPSVPTSLASLLAVAPPPASEAPSTAPAASDTPEPSTVESAEPSAVATDIDPCQLITADEAGQLAGTTFGPGKATTTEGNAKICTYGAQTKNVFMVDLAIAPSTDIAKADETAVLAELQQQAAAAGKNAVQTSAVKDFAPNTDAVIVKMGPILGINGAAIYLLRGTTFFGFSDLVVGGNAPTIDDVKAKALDVLTNRLP
jgi:hypothetical protein